MKDIKYTTGINLWYKSGEEPVLIKWVLVFNEDKNQFQVIFSTDLTHSAKFIIESFILRWSLEVTFEETRAHLGVETQRQWADKAITRSTPLLMGLFSLISIIGSELIEENPECLKLNNASWYDKKHATFSDIHLLVKQKIINGLYFNNSTKKGDMIKLKISEFNELINTVLSAA